MGYNNDAIEIALCQAVKCRLSGGVLVEREFAVNCNHRVVRSFALEHDTKYHLISIPLRTKEKLAVLAETVGGSEQLHRFGLGQTAMQISSRTKQSDD